MSLYKKLIAQINDVVRNYPATLIATLVAFIGVGGFLYIEFLYQPTTKHPGSASITTANSAVALLTQYPTITRSPTITEIPYPTLPIIELSENGANWPSINFVGKLSPIIQEHLTSDLHQMLTDTAGLQCTPVFFDYINGQMDRFFTDGNYNYRPSQTFLDYRNQIEEEFATQKTYRGLSSFRFCKTQGTLLILYIGEAGAGGTKNRGYLRKIDDQGNLNHLYQFINTKEGPYFGCIFPGMMSNGHIVLNCNSGEIGTTTDELYEVDLVNNTQKRLILCTFEERNPVTDEVNYKCVYE